MAFTNLKLTTFGQNLDAKCKLGKGLHLSRVVIGDGLLGNGSMVNRTALVRERYSMLVDAKQLTEAGAVAAIVSTLDNSGFTEGFLYRELGLMGVDPDTSQEGLYLYDNAGEECEFLDTRANGVVIYERLKLLIKTQDAASITFDSSGNPLYLGVDDPVSGNTVTFTQAEARAEIQSGETLAVLFGKAKKWFASLGSAAFTDSSSYAASSHASSHATGGADPLTPAQIGAATTLTLTVTVPTGWTASGGYYYKQVSVPGMLATDNPIADILPGSDNAANKLYAEAWSKVQSIDILDDGTVKLWATSAPTTSFSLQFKITRTGNETGQGKCILAGHPPVGGQIGYGTYTGNGAVSRTISLGITPKWVLVLCKGAFVGEFGTNGANGFGGLALAGSPAVVFGSLNCVAIVPGGFQVSYDSISGSYYYARTNDTSTTYNYIYGT